MRKKKIEVLDFKIDLERPMIMWTGFFGFHIGAKGLSGCLEEVD